MNTTAHPKKWEHQLTPHRFTVQDFHKLTEVGILIEDMRVELIEGVLVDRVSVGSRHAGAVNHLNRLFTRGLSDAIVAIQNPIVLGEGTELYPDLLIAKHRDDVYSHSNPAPDDVLLLIEVADSSLRGDRESKIPLYGKFCVAEVWLFDVYHNRLEVFRGPSSNGYFETMRPGLEELISPTLIPSLKIEVRKLFVDV